MRDGNACSPIHKPLADWHLGQPADCRQGDRSFVSVVDARSEKEFSYLDFETKAEVDGDACFSRFIVATHVEVAVLESPRARGTRGRVCDAVCDAPRRGRSLVSVDARQSRRYCCASCIVDRVEGCGCSLGSHWPVPRGEPGTA